MALLVTELTATTAWATTIDGVSYIDENGVAQTANGVTVLEGGGATTLSAGWYVVNSKIDYTGTVTLSGNISSSDYKAKLDGKTLTPYMTVAAKVATVGGQTDYWTTLYRGDAGFAIVAEENACAYTATVSGSEITLHRLGKVIPQGTAVIIVGED